MNRNHLFVATVVLCAAAFVPASVSAQTTADIAVSATVNARCTITAAPVAFGVYDPLVTNAVAPLDGMGSVTVACTKGSVPTIALGPGAHASGSTRRMIGAATPNDLLTYELYQPAGYTAVWGTTGPNLYTAAAAADKTARTFTVNGRVAGSQDVSTGTYNDTVVATVNF